MIYDDCITYTRTDMNAGADKYVKDYMLYFIIYSLLLYSLHSRQYMFILKVLHYLQNIFLYVRRLILTYNIYFI